MIREGTDMRAEVGLRIWLARMLNNVVFSKNDVERRRAGMHCGLEETYCQSMASSTLSKPSGRELRIMGMCGRASIAEPGNQ